MSGLAGFRTVAYLYRPPPRFPESASSPFPSTSFFYPHHPFSPPKDLILVKQNNCLSPFPFQTPRTHNSHHARHSLPQVRSFVGRKLQELRFMRRCKFALRSHFVSLESYHSSLSWL